MQIWRYLAALFLVGSITSFVDGQPIEKEGTEMIENENGDLMPKEIIWPKDGSEMIYIPHGTFIRGYDNGDPREGPAREIMLGGFYIDKYEVSNKQYEEFLEEGTGLRPRPSNKELLREDRPVVSIPWTSARDYARWAGKQLPTEAMWEKAARGPENFLYIGGNEPPSPDKMVVDQGDDTVTRSVDENIGDVNGYGLYHMGGNVSEWVYDWYSRTYNKDSLSTDPLGPEKGDAYVYRGGSFRDTPEETRLTIREGLPGNQQRDYIGFRTVWVPVKREVKPNATPRPTPTPEPTDEEILDEIVGQMMPFLEKGEPRLPKELKASRAYIDQGEDDVQFINFTPFRISLNFVGVNEELVFKYNEPLPSMTYRSVTLPRERDLTIVAYAQDAPRQGPIVLGSIRAESRTIITIHSELFTKTVNNEGNVIELNPDIPAQQYYSDFSPKWNELEIYNPLNEPIILHIDDTTSGRDRAIRVEDLTVDPGVVVRLVLRGGRYDFYADYIGASEPSSNKIEVSIDDSAARRLFTISQDKSKEGGVNVLTMVKPYLALDLYQARHVTFSRN